MNTKTLFPKILTLGFLLVSFSVLTLQSQVATGSTDVKAKDQPSSTIPTEVNKVFTTSCLQCHGDGGGMAKIAVNFSKWEDYSAEVKAKKAKEINDAIVKGSMPPKGFVKTHPEAAMLKEQVELVKKWSETFVVKK